MVGGTARDRDRSVRCPLAYEEFRLKEFRLKEFERDRDGTWVDEIPDGNDRSIDAVRHAAMDDVLGGVGVSRRREVLLACLLLAILWRRLAAFV